MNKLLRICALAVGTLAASWQEAPAWFNMNIGAATNIKLQWGPPHFCCRKNHQQQQPYGYPPYGAYAGVPYAAPQVPPTWQGPAPTPADGQSQGGAAPGLGQPAAYAPTNPYAAYQTYAGYGQYPYAGYGQYPYAGYGQYPYAGYGMTNQQLAHGYGYGYYPMPGWGAGQGGAAAMTALQPTPSAPAQPEPSAAPNMVPVQAGYQQISYYPSVGYSYQQVPSYWYER